MSNFEEYGFEADFKGEILKVIDNMYFGIAKIDVGHADDWRPMRWDRDGRGFISQSSEYDLIPIKKEWYECPNNFPCLVMEANRKDDICSPHLTIIGNILAYNSIIQNSKIRLATEEEALSLVVKDK